jgi:hypothetical protein
MQATVWFRRLVVAAAVWVTLVGLYLLRPLLGLMTLSALGGFLAARCSGRPRLSRDGAFGLAND